MLRHICTNLIFNMVVFKKKKKKKKKKNSLSLIHTCISLYIHPEHTAVNLQYNSYNNIISFLMPCDGILTHSACKACSRSQIVLGKPRSLWTGIIMLENPKVMLLQIRYYNRLDNSVTVPLSSDITRYYDEICLPIMIYVCPPKPSRYHPHNGHVRQHHLGPASPLVSSKFEPCHQQIIR